MRGATEFPQPLYLVSGDVGLDATSPAPIRSRCGPSLSMADGAIDTTKDLTITFSCDRGRYGGSRLRGLAGPRRPARQDEHEREVDVRRCRRRPASAQCIAVAPGGTITVKAAQLTALVGGQTGGSIQLALARLRLTRRASDGSHTLGVHGRHGRLRLHQPVVRTAAPSNGGAAFSSPPIPLLSSRMRVRVLYFAVVRERLRRDDEELELPAGATADDGVARSSSERHPELGGAARGREAGGERGVRGGRSPAGGRRRDRADSAGGGRDRGGRVSRERRGAVARRGGAGGRRATSTAGS